jgi:hypothetical protein
MPASAPPSKAQRQQEALDCAGVIGTFTDSHSVQRRTVPNGKSAWTSSTRKRVGGLEAGLRGTIHRGHGRIVTELDQRGPANFHRCSPYDCFL